MIETIVTDEEWDGENPPTVFMDWLGQEVRVGDTVIYAVTKGRSAAVVAGEILEFRIADSKGQPLQRTWNSYGNEGNRRVITETHTKHLWNFKIRPIKDALPYWSGRDRDKNGDIRSQVIGTIHNITKVDASLVDEVDA
jgi:hypothetical protein